MSVQSVFQIGENVLAIQVHNSSQGSSDLTAIPFLTLGLKQSPANPVGAAPEITLPITSLHTNFKLKSGGEKIFLSDNYSFLIDQINPVFMEPDISFGRNPDGSENWIFYADPTPGFQNGTSGVPGTLGAPLFSVPGGFYTGSLQLSLSSNQTNSLIYYTRNGSEPDQSSTLFISPMNLDETTVVRARVFKPGWLPGKITTFTYFIDENFSLPVVSISSSPENFWDYNTGIYVKGPGAEPSFPYDNSNFWQDWERPVQVEFFENDGTARFFIDAGVKIFGGTSRAFDQKSLAIYARKKYGFGEINYKLFPDKPITKFESFVLRNCGDDWEYAMLRDPIMQGLLKGTELVTQAYRPVIVFLNGDYWGIHNLREKINEHYMASNYNVDPDNIDFLEDESTTLAGDNLHYRGMLDYISDNNLSNSENYEYVQTLMDVNNFIDYQAAQIYFNNQDWPGNNIKFWRPRTANGKWRWLIYDTDFGFGLFSPGAYTENTLDFATATNGPDWPNPPWSTFLLRKLLDNQKFKETFINRFADLLNTNFLYENVASSIIEKKDVIAADIPLHLQNWGMNFISWQNEITVLLNFAKFRNANLRFFIMNKFNLGGISRITVEAEPNNGGSVQINSVKPAQFPWAGYYFQDVPVQLTAAPASGYRFLGWKDQLLEDKLSVSVNLTDSLSVTAIFEPDTGSSFQVVINEINYDSAPDFDPEDWMELYNNSAEQIDVSGWYLKDSNNQNVFLFPEKILSSYNYLIVCRDTLAFKTNFPNVSNFIGNFSFGLSSNGDLIRLFEPRGGIVDSLTYNDVPPWPVEPKGTGMTLALIEPGLDNSLPGSWLGSFDYGTPGEKNSNFTDVGIDRNKFFKPNSFRLYQNYPNPFNGETVIRFELPVQSRIRIEIFDVAGKIVKLVVDRDFEPGYHQTHWRPEAGVTSGLYLLRINAGSEYIKTYKMIFIK